MSQYLETASQLRGYESSSEYFQDQLVVLDLIIETEIQKMSQQQGKQEAQSAVLRGMYVSNAQAHQLLLHNDAYVQLGEEQQQIVTTIESIIQQRLSITERPMPIQRLIQIYGLDELDRRMLIVALAPQLNRKYIRLFGYLQDDLTCQYATLDLMLQLCSRNADDRDEIYRRVMNREKSISKLFASFSTHTSVAKEISYMVVPLAIKPRVVHFLLELPWQYEGKLSGASYEIIADNLTPLIIHKQLQEQLNRYIELNATSATSIAFIGANGAGKTLHSRHLASNLRKTLFIVEASNLVALQDELDDAVEDIMQESSLLDAILVIKQAELLTAPSRKLPTVKLIELLQACLVKYVQLVLLHSTSELPLIAIPNSTSLSVPIPNPTLDEATLLWRNFSKVIKELSVEQSLQLASKFQFTPGQIIGTIDRSKSLVAWEHAHSSTPELYAIIQKAAYQMIHHGLQEKAVKMNSDWSWEDLILPHDTLSLLRQACQRLQHRHIVLQEWGFNRLLPYGKGISMLFTGPPGTGKTMSALVMAKAMNTELYRVDLTRVVSKYIGETEKNLADIFDKAALSGAILFFDEADALFGKRSEVKDSHDKYANMETSYLLQKMEEYEGLTILATNFSQNLDDAFMRRIHYIIKFPFPDVLQREQLWRSMLPDKLPIDELDLPFLAKTFELSGGPIKNIVLTAAYLAIEESSKVTMKHMVEAAVQEYKKTGKLLMRERLGPYSHYWKGG